MINELDEYLKILNCLICKESIEVNPIHEHLLWLLDGSGHAGAIHCNLDDVEKNLKKKCKEFQRHFDNFYMKSLEFKDHTRTNINKLPTLSRLNKQGELEMLLFMSFLKEL